MRAKSLNLNIEIQHLVTACNLLKDWLSPKLQRSLPIDS